MKATGLDWNRILGSSPEQASNADHIEMLCETTLTMASDDKVCYEDFIIVCMAVTGRVARASADGGYVPPAPVIVALRTRLQTKLATGLDPSGKAVVANLAHAFSAAAEISPTRGYVQLRRVTATCLWRTRREVRMLSALCNLPPFVDPCFRTLHLLPTDWNHSFSTLRAQGMDDAVLILCG